MEQLCDDVISIIYQLTNNYYLALVNKNLYNVIQRNSTICQDCHKLITIFGIQQWMTDPNDIYHGKRICHGYYGDLNYYQKIKKRNARKVLQRYPRFLLNNTALNPAMTNARPEIARGSGTLVKAAAG